MHPLLDIEIFFKEKSLILNLAYYRNTTFKKIFKEPLH